MSFHTTPFTERTPTHALIPDSNSPTSVKLSLPSIIIGVLSPAVLVTCLSWRNFSHFTAMIC